MTISESIFKKRAKKSSKKRTLPGRVFFFFKWIVFLLFSSSLCIVFIYKYINPPITPLMAIRCVEQLSKGEKIILKKDWTRIEEISPNMVKAVIAAEDNLFVKHKGFDKEAIEQAIEYNKKGKKIRGGSTISQQTAKNVFLWPSRSYIRKGLEAYFTFLIEFMWGKERIMEVYLNVIETGNGIYGVEKASSIYFQKSSATLTAGQAALIAAALPSPRRYSITSPGPYMRSRQEQLINLMPKIETLKVE